MSAEQVAAAQAAYDAGDLERAHDLAVQALRGTPEDPLLLRIAGRSGRELDLDDAADQLQAVARLLPDDPEAWWDVGLASAEEGDLQGASAAFRRVHDLDPADGMALVHLAHASNALGRPEEAVGLLALAAESDSATPEVLRTLVSLAAVSSTLPGAALQATTRLLDLDPKDVGSALARADLHLALGNTDDARKAYAALRTIDDDDGHEVFAWHGQAEALLRAERWRAALDVAIEATRVDRMQLTTEILQFATAKLFGEADRPAPSWDELSAALADERASHRRMHAEQEISL